MGDLKPNKAFADSMLNDSEKPYRRAYGEYLQDKEAAIKKYPHWANQFAKDLAAEAPQTGSR